MKNLDTSPDRLVQPATQNTLDTPKQVRRLPQRGVRFVAFFLLPMLIVAARPNCDTDPVSLACGSFDVTLDPGECLEIPSLCGPDWVEQDRMKFCGSTVFGGSASDPAPPGLSIKTEILDGSSGTTRSVCAAVDVVPLFQAPIDYYYTTPEDNGEGVITVTIRQPLSTLPSADPASIFPGQTSRLSAGATGGQGPYGYSWSPSEDLDLSTVASPNASPTTTTTYTVLVTDANGDQASGTTTLLVGPPNNLLVTANPSTITNGDFTQLVATPLAGVAPYTYDWQPEAIISPQGASSVDGFPSVTTTFMVTVTDAVGAISSGAVEVEVLLDAFAAANPVTIDESQSSQLLGFAGGGTPPYSFAWSPTAGLDDPNARNPVATPAATTTYTLTVTDALGATASASQRIEVTTGPALNACFTITPLAGSSIEVDASCSTGSIVEYWYWPDFTSPTDPPDVVTTSSTATLSFATPGPKNVRVVVFALDGSTSASMQTYNAP